MNSAGRIDPVLAAEIDRLATALAKDPRSKAFMPLAESYIKADMWQEAAGVLEDGLRVNPGFVTAMAALGRVYEQLGQLGKAKPILAEVVAQSPDNLRAHRILARIFSSERQMEPALQSCEAILAVNPCDVEALSIRQAMTGQIAGDDNRPRVKREKKRLEKSREETSSAPPTITASEPVIPAMPESVEAATASGPLTKTDPVVAQLKAWLKTIHSRRTPISR
ncbi:tetratricopeptide repeat protein [Nitrospira sp. Nam80]